MFRHDQAAAITDAEDMAAAVDRLTSMAGTRWREHTVAPRRAEPHLGKGPSASGPLRLRAVREIGHRTTRVRGQNLYPVHERSWRCSRLDTSRASTMLAPSRVPQHIYALSKVTIALCCNALWAGMMLVRVPWVVGEALSSASPPAALDFSGAPMTAMAC